MQEKASKMKYLYKRIASFCLAFSVVLTVAFARPVTADAVAVAPIVVSGLKFVGTSVASWGLSKLLDEGYDFIFGTDEYETVVDDLANGAYGGGSRRAVSSGDVGYYFDFYLDDASITSYETIYDKGYLIELSYGTNVIDYVLGDSFRYDVGSYMWQEPAVQFYTPTFYIGTDDVFDYTLNAFETKARGVSYSTWVYGFQLQRYNEDSVSWVAVYQGKPSGKSTSTPTGYVSSFDSLNATDKTLVGGYKYRFSLLFSSVNNSASTAGGYYGYDRYIHLSGVSVNSTTDTVNVPVSSRPSGLADVLSQYNSLNVNSGDSYTNYYIGTSDRNGDIVEVYDFDIIDESTMTVSNPASGDVWTVTDWEYDYLSKRYYCTLEDGNYITITYGDDAVTIVYPGDDGSYYEQSYVYVSAYYTAPASTDEDEECEHVYTSETTAVASCTESGLRTYTCSECGFVYNAVLSAIGHSWEVSEVVDPVVDEDGDVLEVGYTVYVCSSCGADTVTYSGAVPESGGPSTVENESWFKWLGSLFKTVISAIVNGCSNTLEYVLETVVVTVTDWLTQLIDWAFSLFDGELVSQWFNWFSDDNSYFASDFGADTEESEVDVWVYSSVS